MSEENKKIKGINGYYFSFLFLGDFGIIIIMNKYILDSNLYHYKNFGRKNFKIK